MPWLICVRDPTPKGSKAESVWTQFASPAELMKADQVLLDDRLGCGDPLCARRHILAWSDELGTHVQSSRHDPVERLTLAEQLIRLYPRSFHETPPEWAQTPDEFNEPFVERQRDGSALSERIVRGERIAATQALAEAAAPVPQDQVDWPPTAPLPDETAPAGVAGARQPVVTYREGS